jgi:hypothetical protein
VLGSGARGAEPFAGTTPESFQTGLQPAEYHMKPEQLLKAIVVGSIVLVGQHLLAAEGESWLRKLGLWPQS